MHEIERPGAASEQSRDVHHLLWETYTRMALIAEEQFDDATLTMATTGTLELIGTHPGSTVADLSRRTPKTQQAISQLVSKLAKRGFIERRVGQGRGVGLYLTEAGIEARAVGIAREQELEGRLQEIFGEELFTQLRTVLGEARTRLHDLA